LLDSITQRREFEEQHVLSKDKAHTCASTKKPVTILELVIHVSQLIRQIKLIASICLTQNFIESNSKMIEEQNMV